MSWFNKNKNKGQSKADISNKTTSTTSKAEYKIVIKERFSKGTTTLKTITAKREIDLDNHVVYLSNVSEGFLELMPRDEKDFEMLDKAEIVKRLAKAKALLQKPKTEDDKGNNKQNYLYDVMKLEAQLRALKYGPDNAYETIDEHGVKEFIFLREGSTFSPFKWDVDTKTIYVASENVKKKAGMARNNKSLKYSKFKNVIEGSVMFMMIINIVMALGLGYVSLKMFQKMDESSIIEAQNFCVQKGAEWTAIVEKNAKASEKIFENLQKATGIDNPFLNNIVPINVEGNKK